MWLYRDVVVIQVNQGTTVCNGLFLRQWNWVVRPISGMMNHYIETWLLYKLTKERLFVTDYSCASGTTES